MTDRTNNFAKTLRHAALGWLALGLVDATQVVVSMRAMGMHHAWVTLFIVTVASWAVWAAFTPVPLALLRRFPLPSRRVTSWLVHALACLAIGVLWAAWAALLEHATNPYAYPTGADPFLPLLRSKMLANLIGDVVLYGAIVALHTAVEAHDRLLHQRAASARLAELLAQAQLAALRVQLEPHFLFNSLNAITALIRVNKGDEAIALTAALGDLLRRVTDRSERQLVTLEEELDFIGKYLDVQRIRFADRLRYRIDVPDSVKAALVPDFIVQPLVENAIKHGIAKRAKGGELTVAAAAHGGTLTLSVYNDGPPLPVAWREGVGLANTRQRLRALYGGAEQLVLRNEAAAGVVATLTFPLTSANRPA